MVSDLFSTREEECLTNDPTSPARENKGSWFRVWFALGHSMIHSSRQQLNQHLSSQIDEMSLTL